MSSRKPLLITLSLLVAVSAAYPLAASAKKSPAEAKQAKSAAQETTAAKDTTTVKASASLKSTPVLDIQTQKTIEEMSQKVDSATRDGLNKMAASIRLEDKAINNDLRDEEELSLTDIGMLWEAAVERSGTIRYAIEKLSHKDATGKPVEGDSFSKKLIQSLVSVGGAAGSMWTGSPASMMGSNMVQQMMMSGNPQNAALSRVTDADMVILAKEVEGLQSQLITLYYNYRDAQVKLNLAKEASGTISKYYDHASNLPNGTADTLQPLMQSIYESAKQDEQNAQQAYASSRSSLTIMVGPEAVAALDNPAKDNTKAHDAEKKNATTSLLGKSAS